VAVARGNVGLAPHGQDQLSTFDGSSPWAHWPDLRRRVRIYSHGGIRPQSHRMAQDEVTEQNGCLEAPKARSAPLTYVRHQSF
jgi:hypothetical protein